MTVQAHTADRLVVSPSLALSRAHGRDVDARGLRAEGGSPKPRRPRAEGRERRSSAMDGASRNWMMNRPPRCTYQSTPRR